MTYYVGPFSNIVAANFGGVPFLRWYFPFEINAIDNGSAAQAATMRANMEAAYTSGVSTRLFSALVDHVSKSADILEVEASAVIESLLTFISNEFFYGLVLTDNTHDKLATWVFSDPTDLVGYYNPIVMWYAQGTEKLAYEIQSSDSDGFAIGYLVERVATAAGIPPDSALRAIYTVFGFLKGQSHKSSSTNRFFLFGDDYPCTKLLIVSAWTAIPPLPAFSSHLLPSDPR